jgi:hypothetical protein
MKLAVAVCAVPERLLKKSAISSEVSQKDAVLTSQN